MDNKRITSKEAAKALSKFIVENFHHCPIDINVNITDCGCWGSADCAMCILRNAEHLNGEVM